MVKEDNNNYNPISPQILEEYNKQRLSENKKLFCYAPLKSIYFTYQGEAYSCCENHGYKLGDFPKQSLKEIWFGNRTNTLRDYIKHNDLSLGCNTCKHYLEIGNFNGVKARFYDDIPSESEYPVRMEFELDNTCNLECIMCDGWSSSLIRKNRDQLPPIKNPYQKDFINQLEEFIPHLNQTHFVGGEPFVMKIYYDIWERIIQINPKCRITVQTNASVMNDKIMSLLERGNFSINVSLDTLNPVIYHNIRRNANFDKVLSNTLYFIEYCKKNDTDFYLTPCPMQHNWFDMPELMRFASMYDIKVIFHSVLYPQKSSLFGFSDEKLSEIYHLFEKEHFKTDTTKEIFNLQSFNTLMFQLQNYYNNDIKRDEYLKFEKMQGDDIILWRKDFEDIEYQKKLIEEQKKEIEKRKKELLHQQLIINKQKNEIQQLSNDKRVETLQLFDFFRNEITEYIKNNSEKEKTNEISSFCMNKFDDFFNSIQDKTLIDDIVLTIYSTTAMTQIVQSLKEDSKEVLYEGYLSRKQ